MVGQSEVAELTGLSDLEFELVSDRWGEYFLASGNLLTLTPSWPPMFLTRLALFGTTLAVFTPEDRVKMGVAETRLLSNAAAMWFSLFLLLDTAVEG